MIPAETTVLIPAAGRVPEGLLALSNISCSAMIPVGGRPVIHWTISYLRSLGFRRFLIAVSRRGMFVEDFVACAFGGECDVQFIVPTSGRGVGGTLVDLASSTSGATLVVLGDTHFTFSPDKVEDNSPFVLTHKVSESYRWCIAEASPSGHLSALHDKVSGLAGELEALIGVYYFPDHAKLITAASANLAAAIAAERNAELAGVLRLIHAESPIRVESAAMWIDSGNPDMQVRAHQTLIQARAFNQLTIDEIRGTITKRSVNVEKFIDEMNFLRLLPPDLAILFPRLVRYSADWADAWMEMEYYGYPSLSEVFVYENLDPGIWERVFAHLAVIMVDAFGKHTRPLPDGTLHEMYVAKTQRRLATMRCSPALAALVQHPGPIEVNGRRLSNFSQMWPRIETAVSHMQSGSRGTAIHGDLCLSNILYDLRSRICKLIDPRGSFGSVGMYGDPRYDVAKLWHSVHGLYDFIVNDLFVVSSSRASATLTIRATPAQRGIEDRFTRVFFAGRFDRNEVQLVTALLFASMPALHDDKPNRQLAMYLRALQLLADWEERS